MVENPMAKDYEQLGKFYLGREYSLPDEQSLEPLVLYDSPDLTTHAMIVGMTGSGKTGLGIALLEEALMDNIPLIAIDPKGDLGNLMLTFDRLSADQFAPWVDSQSSEAKGQTSEAIAQQQSERWKKGLAQWGQSADRIRQLHQQSEVALYTPGSSAGRSISVLKSLDAPPAAIMSDLDLRREHIQTTATSLLGLMDMEADPLTSREHILLSNILESVWTAGNSIDLAGLIQAIQSPPFEQIGVMSVDQFYPAKDRSTLAMRLNNLLAAPGFESWLKGEPLDIQKLLYTPEGKARAAIFSTAHLSDREKMFFTTMLLNAFLSWMRTQSGTSSLRVLLYIDEIFGYLPPVANPPSKLPLLTLLKQARAFGVGLVLSTQNPADLDYKALSNMGTWFIGRLQTERDKARLIEGLRGQFATEATEATEDSPDLAQLLGQLSKRVFLLHNVHEDRSVVFQTRWTMSYLSGPMTRSQIKQLNQLTQDTESYAAQAQQRKEPKPSDISEPKTAEPDQNQRKVAPALPPEISVYYLPTTDPAAYQPFFVMAADVHYLSKTYGVDETRSLFLAVPILPGSPSIDWTAATALSIDPVELKTQPLEGATFQRLPVFARKEAAFKKWQLGFLRYVRNDLSMKRYQSKKPKLVSTAGETKEAFWARLRQLHREKRDAAIAKLQQRYAKKLEAAQNKLMRAEQAVDRRADAANRQKVNTAIAVGSTLLGAFMGRKMTGYRAVNSAGRAMRTARRVGQSQATVQQAKQKSALVQEDLSALESELQQALIELKRKFDAQQLAVTEVSITPNSTQVTQRLYGLLWMTQS